MKNIGPLICDVMGDFKENLSTEAELPKDSSKTIKEIFNDFEDKYSWKLYDTMIRELDNFDYVKKFPIKRGKIC